MRRPIVCGSLLLSFTLLIGPTKPAFARRGGWSQDPYWWRIEVCAVTLGLAVSLLAFGANRVARHRDDAARARIETFTETTNADDCLEDL